MKTRPVIVGLVVVVAALAGWATRIDAILAQANSDLAAVDKKLAAAQKEASAAQAESANLAVEIADNATRRTNGGPAGGNNVPELKVSAAPDPQAMLAAAQDLPPGPGRDRAMELALTALAGSDPQAAWDLAQDLPDGSSLRLVTLKNILAAWSATDPAKAASMLDALSVAETADSPTNITGVVESNWLKQDPAAAAQWIDTLPVGNTRDSAIMALAAGVADADLPAAFKWVTTMADPSKRGGTINKVVTQWANTDPVAARNAVLAQYTDNNNGRQAALLAIIARAAPDLPLNPDASGVGAPGP